MPWRRLLVAFLISTVGLDAATVLVLQFHNNSQYPDLNWVGESIAQKLHLEFSAANQIVLTSEARAEGLRRLGLRSDADFTKATLIKLGVTLDVDYLCYGSFDSTIPDSGSNSPDPKSSSINIAAHFLDLRKMRDGRDFSEAGRLTDLSRLEEHLAWQSLAYIDPGTTRPMEQFLSPQKFVRLEAEESFARGLLSANPDSRAQWFRQATILDGRFVSPAYELGRLSLSKKDYRGAITWFNRVPGGDPRYPDARFRMGYAAYRAADYNSAVNYFREVAQSFPLNEVYNNLGAAENQLNLAGAAADFKRAAEGDHNDPTYLFNLGAALLKANQFDEAAKWLQATLDHKPDDQQAKSLLDRAHRREGSAPNAPPLAPDRLKQNFDETAFRQLRALLQPKQPKASNP